MAKLKVGESVAYVTRSTHGDRPAGTPCSASRDDTGNLVLDFGDAKEILLPPYYLAGIEDRFDDAFYLAM